MNIVGSLLQNINKLVAKLKKLCDLDQAVIKDEYMEGIIEW